MGLLDIVIVGVIAFLIWLWFQVKQRDDEKFFTLIQRATDDIISRFGLKEEQPSSQKVAGGRTPKLASKSAAGQPKVPADPSPSSAPVRSPASASKTIPTPPSEPASVAASKRAPAAASKLATVVSEVSEITTAAASEPAPTADPDAATAGDSETASVPDSDSTPGHASEPSSSPASGPAPTGAPESTPEARKESDATTPSTSSVRTAAQPDVTSSRNAMRDKASFRANEKVEVISEYERKVPRGISEERLGFVKSKSTPKVTEKNNTQSQRK
ncbi:hypothetical protein QR680_008936 [Steinernema hermaphroditum]|uniref:Uncharacterized protein n=1 Tax=Steinernema hermaphroditum TaxID=289476 RepID=A0AA39IKX6_9BILA|nr:hypothetical protein QR680_008936 [Steinernema hermaphroditum]